MEMGLTEPIQWSTLTVNQRNALVAQHVFGRKVVKWREDRDLLLEREGKPGQHESVPAYTESMDAAWRVLQRMARSNSIAVDFTDHLDFAANASYDLIKEIVTWTPEKVCIAALRAQGLIIEGEEKQ